MLFLNKKEIFKNNQRGFTLVELLVSVFLFSIVMTISMGALLVLLDANQKGQGVQTVMSNLSFAIDSMTRNVRTGYAYNCQDWDEWDDDYKLGDNLDDNDTNDCKITDDGAAISFIDGRTLKRMAYGYYDDPADLDGYIRRKIDDGPWMRLTSDELNVTNFTIVVEGSDQGITGSGAASDNDYKQPTAQFLIEGYIVSDEDTDIDFRLQTEITQRTLDF